MATPSTPTNLLVQTGNGTVYLNWNVSAGATSYNVYRSLDSVTYTVVSSPTVAEYTDSTVVTGVQYYYKVSAFISTNESAATSPQGIVPTNTGVESLASLRLQAQQRADRVNSNFVGTVEWNKYINQSYFELYDILTTLYEDYNLAAPYTFVTDGTSNAYTLPNGTLVGTDSVTTKLFYKLLGVDMGLANNNNARTTVHKFDFIDRNRYVYPNVSSTYFGVFNARYRVMGDKIRFIPTPSGGQYITIWYIPRMTSLVKDTDLADGVSGWTEYIIVDAAIKALQKEESDVSVLMAEKAALKQRIEETAMNRDAGQPDTISNTRSWGARSGQGGGPGWDGSYGGF